MLYRDIREPLNDLFENYCNAYFGRRLPIQSHRYILILIIVYLWAILLFSNKFSSVLFLRQRISTT